MDLYGHFVIMHGMLNGFVAPTAIVITPFWPARIGLAKPGGNAAASMLASTDPSPSSTPARPGAVKEIAGDGRQSKKCIYSPDRVAQQILEC